MKDKFAAENHYSDLNIFGAIVAILEGGCLYTISGKKMGTRIISLCQMEMQKQVAAYDHARRIADRAKKK